MGSEVYIAVLPYTASRSPMPARPDPFGFENRVDRLRKVGVLLPSDFEGEHPRWPKLSPGGIGGEFAPKDGATGAGRLRALSAALNVSAFGVFALTTARSALKAALSLGPALGTLRSTPFRVGFAAILRLAQGVKGGLAHVRAALDFRGGKTLEEIINHPGGPGYQLHHFLENTAENRLRLPPGFRDMKEQKGYIPTFAHEDIHAALSKSASRAAGKSVRDTFRELSPEEQRQAMFKIMREKGVLK